MPFLFPNLRITQVFGGTISELHLVASSNI